MPSDCSSAHLPESGSWYHCLHCLQTQESTWIWTRVSCVTSELLGSVSSLYPTVLSHLRPVLRTGLRAQSIGTPWLCQVAVGKASMLKQSRWSPLHPSAFSTQPPPQPFLMASPGSSLPATPGVPFLPCSCSHTSELCLFTLPCLFLGSPFLQSKKSSLAPG